jgi:hypothetical protein
MSEVTQILERTDRGDPKAADQMLPLVYEELRKVAAAKMANEAAGNTLQPTALVHEAWVRLVGKDSPQFAGRAHFFAAAAEAMRRILIHPRSAGDYEPGDRHCMDLHLHFGGGPISGKGNDDVGRFLIRGRYNAVERECYWTKTYPGSHDVYYRGFREGEGIWGT